MPAFRARSRNSASTGRSRTPCTSSFAPARTATFASKGHDLFATIHGRLSLDNDRKAIDRLWNPYVAAWFEGGKDDPTLALLRFDTEKAEIWEDASSLVTGIKMLLGYNPQEDFKDKVASVKL